jgi:pimeloyl-ACP methyl ester carboxylesterase/putative sterol carrier protein
MAIQSPGAAPSPELIRTRLRGLPKRFRQESANGLVAEWELRLGSQRFAVSIADHACTVREGPAAAPASVISTDPGTWLAMDQGSLTGGEAFLDRRLTASGNLDLAVRLQTLFRPYRRTRKPSDLDHVEVAADGLKLSAYVLGQGDPVLLLHGLGGTKITWLPLLGALGERHRVIVPDLPGHGESDKPRTDYSPRFYARVIRRLLDSLGIEQAVVIGNSMGGRIALELALRSPDRVACMGLLSPAVPGFRWRYILGFTRVFPTEWGGIPFPLREKWMETVIRRLFADPSRLPESAYSSAAKEFIRIYRDPVARMAFFSSLRHIVTERPEPFYSSLRRIKQPVLVAFGDQDRTVPPRLGVRLAQRLPNSEYVALPGCGHVPQFEATEATEAVVAAFLASSPRGKPEL